VNILNPYKKGPVFYNWSINSTLRLKTAQIWCALYLLESDNNFDNIWRTE